MIFQLKRIFTLFCAVFFLIISLCSSSFAFDSALLWGRVVGEANNPIHGAHFLLIKNKQDNSQAVLSDQEGIFFLIGVSPGLYSLHIECEGYHPLYQEEIFLEPGQSLYMDITLILGTKDIMSSSKLQRLDYASNTHQTVLNESNIYHMPSAHNIWHLVENQDLSATTNRIDVGGLWGNIPGLFSSRGGVSWTQTEYYLNGIDVGDPYQTGIPLFHPDFFSLGFTQLTNAAHPVQVLSPGGAFNLITRNGNDDYSGGLEVYFIDSLLQSSNISPALQKEGILENHSFNSMINGNLHFSGPLVQNKLYYYSSISANDTSRNIAEFEEYDKSSLISGLFSLDYQADSSSFKLLWTGQIRSNNSYGADRNIPFSATSIRKDYFNVLQAIWKTRVGENHAFKTGLSYAHGKLNFDPQENDRMQHGYEIFRMIPSGSTPFVNHESRDLLTFLFQGDSFIKNIGKAQHHLQYGVQARLSSSTSDTDIFENLHLRFFNNDPLEVVFFNTPVLHRESAFHLSGIFQDTITLGNLFSIYFGAQLAYSRGWIPGSTVQDEGAKITWLNISPRFGMTIPLSRDKSSALKISLARYYYALPLSYLTYGHPDALGGLVYSWNDANQDGQFQPGEKSSLLRREGAFYSDIDPELKRPCTDELSISYLKSFTPGWILTLSGFIRETRNLIETLNTGVPFSSYSPENIFDIGDDRVFNTHDDLIFVVYNQNSETLGQDFFLLTNDVGEKRITKYYGADLTLIKKFGKTFTFFFSLTATTATGTTNPGNTEWENDDGVIGTLYDNPNTLINARGRVRFDRAYVGRIGLNYLMPLGFRFACVIKYYDGQPFARKIIVTGMNQGPFYIQAHPRGVSRYEYNRTIEVRLEKTFCFGEKKFRIILDIFNILNRGLATEENEWTGPIYPLRYATEIQSPRVFRLGLAYDF